MPTTLTTEQLQPFCAADDSPMRFSGIAKPFHQSGYTYATDGSVMVRIPTTEADTECTSDYRVPSNVANILAIPTKVGRGIKIVPFDFSKCSEPWPEVFPENTEACPMCNGTGHKEAECDHCGHKHPCHAAGDCKKCRGSGVIESMVIAGRSINCRYATMIAQLGNAKFWPGDDRADGGKANEKLFFVAGENGEIQGAVMPMA